MDEVYEYTPSEQQSRLYKDFIGSNNTFTLHDGQSLTISEIPYGATVTITEVDYTDEGYKTKVNGVNGRTFSAVITEDGQVHFENRNNTAVPTEIRFAWLAGIPLVLIPISWFIYSKRKKVKKIQY